MLVIRGSGAAHRSAVPEHSGYSDLVWLVSVLTFQGRHIVTPELRLLGQGNITGVKVQGHPETTNKVYQSLVSPPGPCCGCLPFL